MAYLIYIIDQFYHFVCLHGVGYNGVSGYTLRKLLNSVKHARESDIYFTCDCSVLTRLLYRRTNNQRHSNIYKLFIFFAGYCYLAVARRWYCNSVCARVPLCLLSANLLANTNATRWVWRLYFAPLRWEKSSSAFQPVKAQWIILRNSFILSVYYYLSHKAVECLPHVSMKSVDELLNGECLGCCVALAYDDNSNGFELYGGDSGNNREREKMRINCRK